MSELDYKSMYRNQKADNQVLARRVADLEAELKEAREDKRIDVELEAWESIKSAALESDWIPREYLIGDWVSDVCCFLKNHNKELKEQEWIPVSERLPEEDQEVLVYTEFKDYELPNDMTLAWIKQGQWEWGGLGIPMIGVTHWKPIVPPNK